MSNAGDESDENEAKEIILVMDDDVAAENFSRYMAKLSLNRRESRKWSMNENYLYQAIRRGEDASSLAATAMNIEDLNISHFDGISHSTFLTLALEADNLKAFKLLIDMGCNPFWIDPKGVSLFHHFGLHGGLAFVLAACKDRSPSEIYYQVQTVAKNGRTPALEAAMHGHADILEFCVDFGADVTRGGPGDWTCAHAAAKNGHYGILRYLLTVGADPDAFASHPSLGHGLSLEEVAEDGDAVKYILSEYYRDYKTLMTKRENYPVVITQIPNNLDKYLV